MGWVFPLFLFLSCLPFSAAQGWNTFGQEHRQPVLDAQYPWSTVGYLSTDCTGTLVYRDLVLTAAHCVIASDTHALHSSLTYFFANLIDGKALKKSWIKDLKVGTRTFTPLSSSWEKDWAILRLKNPLGDSQGWMGVSKDLFETVSTVSYADNYRDGKTAGIHSGCAIHKRRGKLFYHDCDIGSGASGSPVYGLDKAGNPWIIGINVGERRQGAGKSLALEEYSFNYANIGLSAGAFADALVRLESRAGIPTKQTSVATR